MFAQTLIIWHKQNPRPMPWLETKNPYKIWISEIILQQTRVVQGWQYYERFIERFPDITSLYHTHESDVLKYWEGLGYYSRARNIKKAADQIFTAFHGKFPDTYETLLSLPGIGPYTASAIAGFAYDLPYPVLDGNVARFLARFLAVESPPLEPPGKKIIAEFLSKAIQETKPSAFNQAIMNFGALICKPAKPNCNVCPFTTGCKAYQLQLTDQLPVTLPKKEKTNRYFHYFILYHAETGRTVIQQRSGKDIWQNLYEFPLIEHDAEGELLKQKSDVLLSVFDINPDAEQPLLAIHKTQNLTHQKIHFNIQIFLWNGLIKDKTGVYQTVKVSNLSSFGFPVTLAKMVSQLKNMIGSTIKEKQQNDVM